MSNQQRLRTKNTWKILLKIWSLKWNKVHKQGRLSLLSDQSNIEISTICWWWVIKGPAPVWDSDCSRPGPCFKPDKSLSVCERAFTWVQGMWPIIHYYTVLQYLLMLVLSILLSKLVRFSFNLIILRHSMYHYFFTTEDNSTRFSKLKLSPRSVTDLDFQGAQMQH